MSKVLHEQKQKENWTGSYTDLSGDWGVSQAPEKKSRSGKDDFVKKSEMYNQKR